MQWSSKSTFFPSNRDEAFSSPQAVLLKGFQKPVLFRMHRWTMSFCCFFFFFLTGCFFFFFRRLRSSRRSVFRLFFLLIKGYYEPLLALFRGERQKFFFFFAGAVKDAALFFFRWFSLCLLESEEAFDLAMLGPNSVFWVVLALCLFAFLFLFL